MSARQVLLAAGLALCALGLATARVQTRATSCPVHDQRLGPAGWILAGVAGLAGLGLLAAGALLEG